jgi:hypothetical protein
MIKVSFGDFFSVFVVVILSMSPDDMQTCEQIEFVIDENKNKSLV